MAHVSTSSPSSLRALAVAWLVVALAVGVLGSTLAGLAERTREQATAYVLLLLAAVGVGLGLWILRTGHRHVREASLAGSALWLVGAVVVVPLQRFAGDMVAAAGPLLLGALVTASVAWWAGHRLA